jgi:hypothetical protein
MVLFLKKKLKCFFWDVQFIWFSGSWKVIACCFKEVEWHYLVVMKSKELFFERVCVSIESGVGHNIVILCLFLETHLFPAN